LAGYVPLWPLVCSPSIFDGTVTALDDALYFELAEAVPYTDA
jgi:hypothetical protein